MGCGFGQDLRFLALEKVPTAAMWGTDTDVGLWEQGLDLFRDRQRFEGRFVRINVLDVAAARTTTADAAAAIHPPVDVMLVNQLFHLFGWTAQVTAAKNLIALSKPGTWIMGYQIGSRIGRAVPNIVHTDEGDQKTAFYHNEHTWRQMWEMAGTESGTKWQVQTRPRELSEWSLEPEDSRWMGPNAVGLDFLCRRVDKDAETR